MRIVYGDIIDWEPMVLGIAFSTSPRPSCEQIEADARSWYSTAAKKKVCRCKLHELTVEDAGPSRCTLNIEWACERCLAGLVDFLAGRHPGIDEVTVGIVLADGDDDGPENPYIDVPGGPVLLEDGTILEVAPFQVLQEPVTVGMFDLFTRFTGYVTIAERRGGEDFRSNGTLAGSSARIRRTLGAVFIAYEDAIAYAAWSGTRLPTEGEWLAMANANSEVYADEEAFEAAWPQIRRKVQAGARGMELTSTVEPGGVVARKGPWWARVKGWENKIARNKRLVSPQWCSIHSDFRTVRSP